MICTIQHGDEKKPSCKVLYNISKSGRRRYLFWFGGFLNNCTVYPWPWTGVIQQTMLTGGQLVSTYLYGKGGFLALAVLGFSVDFRCCAEIGW